MTLISSKYAWEDRAATLVSLYILSGCDYTSFVGYGKASLWRTSLIMHHWYLQTPKTDQDHWHVSRSLASLHGWDQWEQFITQIYFPHHTSPQSLFISLQSQGRTVLEQHYLFTETLRSGIWKSNLWRQPDTVDALKRHTCWVVAYWKQPQSNKMHILPITSYGWKKENATIQVDWDSETNFSNIREKNFSHERLCMQTLQVHHQTVFLCSTQ